MSTMTILAPSQPVVSPAKERDSKSRDQDSASNFATVLQGSSNDSSNEKVAASSENSRNGRDGDSETDTATKHRHTQTAKLHQQLKKDATPNSTEPADLTDAQATTITANPSNARTVAATPTPDAQTVSLLAALLTLQPHLTDPAAKTGAADSATAAHDVLTKASSDAVITAPANVVTTASADALTTASADALTTASAASQLAQNQLQPTPPTSTAASNVIASAATPTAATAPKFDAPLTPAAVLAMIGQHDAAAHNRAGGRREEHRPPAVESTAPAGTNGVHAGGGGATSTGATGPAYAAAMAATATASTTAAATAPAAAASAAAVQLENQVAEPVLRLSANGDGVHRVLIQLHPLDLGPVSVEVRMRDGNVSVALSSGNESTRAAMTAALPALHQQLTDAGLTDVTLAVDSSSVGSSGGGAAGGQNGQAQLADQQYRTARMPATTAESSGAAKSEAGSSFSRTRQLSTSGTDRWL